MRPHLGRLYRAARRYAASEHDAQDLVQESLLRAWRAFSPTEERVYHRPWLFVMLRNVAAEWARAAHRRIKLVPMPDAELTEFLPTELTDPLAPFPAMADEDFRGFLREQIEPALQALDTSFREVLVLSVAGGLTYREIAEVLACPLGTVMSRVARARRQLRERLSELAHVSGTAKEAQA